MTLLEELEAWLQRPHYKTGVALYSRLEGHSTLKLRLFEQGYDDFNSRKLAQVLREAYEQALLSHRQRQDAYPTPLKQELATAKQLMDMRQALKERIRTLHEQGADAGQIQPEAFRILDITDQITAIYGKKKFLDQHGYLPEPATHESDSRESLVLRRNTVRTYISRLTRQVDKAFDEDRRLTLTTRLAAYQSELHDIDTRLAELS